ncbi:MAG: helix-turn-helix domain-containing protein [Desulfitobacteriaceae bacterium]|nr:helix-turn-helix domain-containing protein [Desulfitobacteriaceae bacterium]MDI6915043.1 helix-turn-helix domain-containing protein [Desulfitobacteriaceae bacterium]
MIKTERQKEWESLISNYRTGGQSAKAWCAAHDVTPRQLWYWLRKYRTKDNASPVNSTKWLPVEVGEQAPTHEDSPMLVKVGKASIEVKPGFDSTLFSEVVHILVALC